MKKRKNEQGEKISVSNRGRRRNARLAGQRMKGLFPPCLAVINPGLPPFLQLTSSMLRARWSALFFSFCCGVTKEKKIAETLCRE